MVFPYFFSNSLNKTSNKGTVVGSSCHHASSYRYVYQEELLQMLAVWLPPQLHACLLLPFYIAVFICVAFLSLYFPWNLVFGLPFYPCYDFLVCFFLFLLKNLVGLFFL